MALATAPKLKLDPSVAEALRSQAQGVIDCMNSTSSLSDPQPARSVLRSVRPWRRRRAEIRLQVGDRDHGRDEPERSRAAVAQRSRLVAPHLTRSNGRNGVSRACCASTVRRLRPVVEVVYFSVQGHGRHLVTTNLLVGDPTDPCFWSGKWADEPVAIAPDGSFTAQQSGAGQPETNNHIETRGHFSNSGQADVTMTVSCARYEPGLPWPKPYRASATYRFTALLHTLVDCGRCSRASRSE